jgi:glucokinase
MVKIGIDVGGTKTRMAYESAGELHPFYHDATPQDPDTALSSMVAAIREADLPGDLAGIGIGCPGPLDPWHGIILSPPNLPDWTDFHLAERMAGDLGVPVTVENDANAGALGEAIHGAGKGHDVVLYITISTGIGAGIVINGSIHRGRRGLAGGIWSYPPGSLEGKPGANITELSSGNGLVARAADRIGGGAATSIPTDDISTHSIIAAYESGDLLAVELVESARATLAGTICFALHLLSPDIVVLGGGLCTNESWFVKPLQEQVRGTLPIDAMKDIPIVRAEHLDEAVLYGALALVKEDTHD